MALKTASIPITDHGAEGSCTNFYRVRYKASSELSWIILNPNPSIPPIILTGLAPSTVYDVEITRFCCDGTQSNPLTTTITTTE